MKKVKYLLLILLTFILFNNSVYAEESKCVQYGNVTLPRDENAALVCLYNKPYADHNEGMAWEGERYKVLVTFAGGTEYENGEVRTPSIVIYVCAATGSSYNCSPFAEFDKNMKYIPGSSSNIPNKIGYFNSYAKTIDSGVSNITLEKGTENQRSPREYITLVPTATNFSLNGCPSEIDLIMRNNDTFYFSFGHVDQSPEIDRNYEKLDLITNSKDIYHFFEYSGDYTYKYYNTNYSSPFLNDVDGYINGAFLPFNDEYPVGTNGLIVLGDELTNTLDLHVNAFATSIVTNFPDDEDGEYMEYYNMFTSYKIYQDAINKYCNGNVEAGVDTSNAENNNQGRNQDIRDYGGETPTIKQTLKCEYYFNDSALCSDPQVVTYYVKTYGNDTWVEAECKSSNISDLSCNIIQKTLNKEINSKNTGNNHKDIGNVGIGGINDNVGYYIQNVGGQYQCSYDNVYLIQYGTDASFLTWAVASNSATNALEATQTVNEKIKAERNQSEDCFTNEIRENVIYGDGVNRNTAVANNTKIVYDCAVDHSKDVACGKVYFIPPQLPYLTNFVMNLIKIFVPIALIIKGLIDLFKAVTGANDKEIEKARAKFFKRLVPAITVFLVILVVQFVFGIISTDGENNTFLACTDCLLNNSCQAVPKNKVLNYCIDMQAEKTDVYLSGNSGTGSRYSGGASSTVNNGNTPVSTNNTSNGCTDENVFSKISVEEAKIGLKAAVDAAGTKREKAVAAAYYLAYNFPNLPYFGGGGHSGCQKGNDFTEVINPKWGSCQYLASSGCQGSTSQPYGSYYPYGMDCSGFVNWAMHQAGIDDENNANGWGGKGTKISLSSISNNSSERAKVKFGDLAWHSGHIGIIVGYNSDEDDFIVAEEAGYRNKTGLVLRLLVKQNNSGFTDVILMDDYYSKH